MQNEDDLRGLAKVMEFMRAISILFVVINIYWFCYQSVREWGIDIGVVFRQNDAGRIYGATFIDHAAKAVFNGSRLGKEFSAGVFNDLFAGQEGIHLPQPSAEVEHPTRQQEHTGASQWDGHDTGYRPDHKDGTTQNVAAAFNLFAPVPGGASGDQPVPPRKRKKKRKYGRQQ